MFLSGNVKSEAELDDRPKHLLDEATRRHIHPHCQDILRRPYAVRAEPQTGAKTAAISAIASGHGIERTTVSGGVRRHAPCSESERRRKQRQTDSVRRPRSHGRNNRHMGIPSPYQRARSTVRKADDSQRTVPADAGSSLDRVLTRPDVATSWAIVPANPAQVSVRQKRIRLQAVGLPTTKTPERTPKGNRLKSEWTQFGQRPDRVKTELAPTPRMCRELQEGTSKEAVAARRRGRVSGSRGPIEPPRQLETVKHRRIRKTEFPDQTARIIKKDPPGRGFTARITSSSSTTDCPACNPSPQRDRHKKIRATRRRRPDRAVSYSRPANPLAQEVSTSRRSRPHRQLQRKPSRRTSSETSCGTRSSATPAYRSSSSRPRSGSFAAASPRKPRLGTATGREALGSMALLKQRSARTGKFRTRHHSPCSTRRSAELIFDGKRRSLRHPIVDSSRGKTSSSLDLLGRAGLLKQKSLRHGTIPTRNHSSSSRRATSLLSRPIVGPTGSKAMGATAIATRYHREPIVERKDGRLRRLKDRLGLIFHHHHHHYHHHPSSGADNYSDRGGRERRHRRSVGELLRGILHHTGDNRGVEKGQRPPPRQGQPHGYLHMLLGGLLRHLWRLPKRRNRRPPRPGGAAAKKLHWWQKIRRRRGVKLASRRRPRLRLGFGRKPSPGRSDRKKKKKK